MFELEKLVRPNMRTMKPYSSARDEFEGHEGVFLDANENPFGGLNRYPDPHQKALKETLSAVKQVPPENIFVGNGSDEVIDLALRMFCIPGKDNVVICPPTYGMYEVLANINDVNIIALPLDKNFQPNVNDILASDAKMIFLCSPNNPTGNDLAGIETILEHFKGIVFIDEAYIDFSSKPSFLNQINHYPNLIVSQTLSKAWGRAAVRVGLAYSNSAIISYFNKAKPPYNVSQLNQQEAIKALKDMDVFLDHRQIILEQRRWLIAELSNLKCIETIYPTDANFILVKTTDANAIYHRLIEDNIIVRNRDSVVKNCLRITVGQPSENGKLIASLRKIQP